MTKEQLIELVRFTAGEIVAPTELSVEDAESIVDDFVDKEQLTIPVVAGRSEQLANFCKKISKQEDCPAEFQEIVNKEFWNLIG